MWWWVIDAVVVVAFAVIGRHDHGYTSDAADYVRVASPFLIGLAVSGLALRGWRQLDLRTGLGLALGTVLIGVLARRLVWGDGTAWTFVMVTTAFMVAGMVGWRLVAAGLSG
jgi:hypothetical protein